MSLNLESIKFNINLNVKASQNTSTSNLDSQSVNGSIAFKKKGKKGDRHLFSNDKVGLTDFFSETQKNVDVYNGVKAKIANDEELAKQLQNSDLNPKDKQNMLNELALTVMQELGYVSNDVKLVYTDEVGVNNTQVKGYFDDKTNTSFVNDKYNNSTTQLIASLGHEITHDMDKQDNIYVSNDKDQNIYATNFGEDLAFYTNGALNVIKGGSLANTNNHNNGIVTTMPSVFNSSNDLLMSNNVQFASLDKSGGDDRQLSTEEKALSFTQNANDLKDALVQTSSLSKNDIDSIFEMTQKVMVNKMDEYMVDLQLRTTYKDKTDEIAFVINEAKQYFTEESKGQTYLDKNSMTLKPMMDTNNFNDSIYNPSSNSAIISSTVGSVIRTGLGLVPNPLIAIPSWVLDTSINYESSGMDIQNTVAPAGLGNPFAQPILQQLGTGISIINTMQSLENYENKVDTLEQKRDSTNSQELQDIYNNSKPIQIKKIETPTLNLIKVNP